jgi:hypothetical protein
MRKFSTEDTLSEWIYAVEQITCPPAADCQPGGRVFHPEKSDGYSIPENNQNAMPPRRIRFVSARRAWQKAA